MNHMDIFYSDQSFYPTVLDTIDHTVNPAQVVDTEVLIDGRYSPQITFEHVCAETVCDEPNFITVIIETESPKESIEVSKTEGLRFWFLDVVQ